MREDDWKIYAGFVEKILQWGKGRRQSRPANPRPDNPAEVGEWLASAWDSYTSTFLDRQPRLFEPPESFLPLVPRTNTANPRLKRLQSGPETFNSRGRKRKQCTLSSETRQSQQPGLASNTRHRIAQCSFCHEAKHTRSRCSKLALLRQEASQVITLGRKNAEELVQFQSCIGDPNFFVVETVSEVGRASILATDFEACKQLPDGVHHIVVKRLYFNPVAVANPSDIANIVEVAFLDWKGDEMASDGPILVKVRHFRTWLVQLKGDR
jgi:hypothetical protein